MITVQSNPHSMQYSTRGSGQNWEHNCPLINFVVLSIYKCFSFLLCCGPTRDMASSFLRFLKHTQQHTTIGRTPLSEWSTRPRDLFLSTHNTRDRKTSMHRRDSKPQSQLASSRKPTPSTTQPRWHISCPPPLKFFRQLFHCCFVRYIAFSR